MKKIILIIIGIIVTISLFAQTDIVGKKYIYEFRDGTTIIGTFIRNEGGNIYINDLENGETYLPKVMVAQIHEVTEDNLKNGEYWFPNLHDTRYFFSPTAFGLRQDEGYYSHSYWLLWQVQYGITDEFSIGGGTTPWGMPATLNAKYSINIDKNFNYAMGWFWVGDLFGWSDGELGSLINMPYLVFTNGSQENNFTIGLGYNVPFNDNIELDAAERLVVNFGGTTRAARRFSLVFEGWLLNSFGEEPMFMGGPGVRYFRKVNRVTAKNGAGAKTFDFQLMRFPWMDDDGPIFIPVLGFSQKF